MNRVTVLSKKIASGKKWIGRHKTSSIVIGIVVLLIAYGIYKSVSGNTLVPRYVLAQVSRGTLISSVTGTGQVSTTNQIDLKPQSAGTLVEVRVNNGDTVKAGQVVAVLDERAALVSLSQARASVETAQANYNKVIAGASTPDIEIAKAAVTSAQSSLQNAQKSQTDVQSQQTILVKNAYSAMLNAGLTAIPVQTFGSTATVAISGTYNGTAQGTYTISINSSGAAQYFTVTGLETYTSPNITTGIPMAIGTQGLYITFSSGVLYPNTSWQITIPNTLSSSYLSASNSYQAALQNQTQAIDQAQASISNSQSSLLQAQAALAQKQAAALPQDIQTAQAQVDTARASLQAAENTYQNNIVTAPFSGQIQFTGIDVQPGGQASQSTAIGTLITQQKIAQISLNEVDVAKIKIGDKATLTFDAVPDLNITGQVIQVMSTHIWRFPSKMEKW